MKQIKTVAYRLKLPDLAKIPSCISCKHVEDEEAQSIETRALGCACWLEGKRDLSHLWSWSQASAVRWECNIESLSLGKECPPTPCKQGVLKWRESVACQVWCLPKTRSERFDFSNGWIWMKGRSTISLIFLLLFLSWLIAFISHWL